MQRRNVLVATILIVLALVMAVGLRGSTQSIQNLAVDFSGVQTAAVATYASNLTQTAAVLSDIHSHFDGDHHAYIDLD